MYRPNTSDTTKMDYFFVYNANDVATTVSLDVFNSAGTQLDANDAAAGNTRTITLAARQTVKLYPRHDLNAAATQQNIGVHLTATSGVSVVVNTALGTEFNAGSSPPWQKHDVVAGEFVPRLPTSTPVRTCGKMRSPMPN